MRRITRLLRRAGDGAGGREAATLSIATILGQAVQFIGAFVLTRLYLPAEFGTFAVFLAINIVLLPLVCFRYEWAIPIADDDDEARGLMGLAMTSAIVTGIAVGVLLHLAVSFFRPAVFDKGIAGWMMPSALIFIGLAESARLWFVRKNAFPVLARTRFTMLAAPVLGQILLGFALGGVNGLLLGYILGHATNALLSVFYCRRVVRDVVRQWNASRLKAAAVKFRRFALFTCPAAMISAVSMQLPIMMMPTLFGSTVAGIYALAQRVVLQPVYLINYSIQTVFWAGAARAFREDPQGVRPRFFDTSAAVALLLVPAFAFAAIAPTLFALCFGEMWRESGVFAGILVIPAITHIIANSTNCLHVCGYNKWQTVIEVGQLLTCAAVLSLAWNFGIEPVTTVYGLAASAVLSHLVLWSSNAIILRRGVGQRDVAQAGLGQTPE